MERRLPPRTAPAGDAGRTRTKEVGMGLFDRHDYGRDYGREAGGRGLGDRMRGAWQRFEARMGGEGHGRGYDRGMMQGGGWNGNRGGGNRGYDAGDFAYRGMEGAWSTARNRGAHDAQGDWRAAAGSRYDQDTSRYDRDLPRARSGGYDHGYGARRGMGGGDYDRDVRGHDPMRTDAGDPFGDRQNRTPFRVMRGGFDAGQAGR